MSSQSKLLLLLTFLLVISVMSCSKHQDEPVPVPAPSTGSYKLDGQLVTCPKITVFEYPNRGGLGADELQIQLLPATAQGPAENMMLTFVKGTGRPVSEYSFEQVTHITFPGSSTSLQTRTYNADRQFTLSVTGTGAYSGTFSCTSPAFGSIGASQLTEGVFTGAHP